MSFSQGTLSKSKIYVFFYKINIIKILLENSIKITKIIAKSKFHIDRFKHNDEYFKFCTGMPIYSVFKAVLNYLEPAASSLLYNNSRGNSSSGYVGRPRKLSSEEELFLVLARLRANYSIGDMAVRFNMSTSTISTILITWYNFLHTRFRSLPIWTT